LRVRVEIEREFVVSSNNDLVFVRQRSKPGVKLGDLMLCAGRREVAGMYQNVSLRYDRRWVPVPLLLAKVVVVRVRDDHKAHVAVCLFPCLDKLGRVQHFKSLFQPHRLPGLCWVVGQGACSASRGSLGHGGFKAGPAQAAIEGLQRNAHTGDQLQAVRLCAGCRRLGGYMCTHMYSPTFHTRARTSWTALKRTRISAGKFFFANGSADVWQCDSRAGFKPAAGWGCKQARVRDADP